MKTYSFFTERQAAGPWSRLWGDTHDWDNYALTAVSLCTVITMAAALLSI